MNSPSASVYSVFSVVAFLCVLLSLRVVAAQSSPKQAVIETTAGAFVIDLAPEAAPNQTAYFMKLAAEGAYDGTIFHRAFKYGMVQGGDPLTKDPAKHALYGTGGLNVIKAEARAPKMTRGSVAAVLIPGKPDSAGAQFFIVLADQPALDNQYTVFGHLSDGIEVLQKISEAAVDEKGLTTDRIEKLRLASESFYLVGPANALLSTPSVRTIEGYPTAGLVLYRVEAPRGGR